MSLCNIVEQLELFNKYVWKVWRIFPEIKIGIWLWLCSAVVSSAWLWHSFL